MSSLEDLQSSFLQAISQEHPTPSETPRLAIYRNAYFMRLIGVLQEDYPVLLHYLGETTFTQLSRQYCQTAPPGHFSLRYFGEQLPTFLATDPAWSVQPQLAELAEWERQLRFLFDCEDASPITAEQLQGFAPEVWGQLVFELVPASLQVIHRHTVVAYWKAVKDGETVSLVPCADSSSRWLLWRNALVTHFRSLSEDEYAALDLVRKKETFARLCEALWEWHEDNAPLVAARYLQGWFREGLIQCVNTSA